MLIEMIFDHCTYIFYVLGAQVMVAGQVEAPRINIVGNHIFSVGLEHWKRGQWIKEGATVNVV
jgi:hypothetical protein